MGHGRNHPCPAQAIIVGALAHARAAKLMPLLVVVPDARAVPKACAAEDGTSRERFGIAHAKANGALALNLDSRGIAWRAGEPPQFFGSPAAVITGGRAMGHGGVLQKPVGYVPLHWFVLKDDDRNGHAAQAKTYG